jgi:hypothetical protein
VSANTRDPPEPALGPVKGCPFCGSGAGGQLSLFKAALPLGGIMYAVLCSQCRTIGPRKAAERDAVQAWNTRFRTDMFENQKGNGK